LPGAGALLAVQARVERVLQLLVVASLAGSASR